MSNFYAIQQAEHTADIYIFGYIMEQAYMSDESAAIDIVQDISSLDADQINVHIDCYGGSVSAGWAIYNALKAHPAKVVTYGDGFVASAALYPFLAGDERRASSLSAYFLHEVMTGADGYADDLRAAADEAEKFTEIGMNAFIERAGMTAERVAELMKAETWLSPQEALDEGIATVVVSDSLPRMAQSAKRGFIQRLLKSPEQKEPHKKDIVPEKKPSLMQIMAGNFEN